MKNAYRVLGLVISFITWPGIRLFLWNSKRAYLLIIVGDEVLVLKTWLGLENHWRLPGGGFKKTESPLKGVLRECHEELGIDLSKHQLKIINSSPYKSPAHFNYWVYSTKLDKKPNLKVNKHEIIDSKWLRISELSSHPCSDELKMAIKTI